MDGCYSCLPALVHHRTFDARPPDSLRSIMAELSGVIQDTEEPDELHNSLRDNFHCINLEPFQILSEWYLESWTFRFRAFPDYYYLSSTVKRLYETSTQVLSH